MTPRGTTGLLTWYAERWAEETPERLHVRGVWHDRETSSALGAPRYSDPFRDYLEGSPFRTDHDERLDTWSDQDAYVRPVHAALARIAGKNSNSRGAYFARYLWQLAVGGFDWQATAERAMVPAQLAPLVTDQLLRMLWHRYSERPAKEVAA